jgi:uncharacterized protein (TIGR02118 family)
MRRKAQAASRAFRTHSNKGWHNANGLIHSAPLACDQSSDRERSKMAQLVVMYKTPKDTAAFDKHYSEKHIQIAKKIPGLRQYEISQGPVATPAGPSGYHLVALLQFDNLAAIQAAFGSAEWSGGSC